MLTKAEIEKAVRARKKSIQVGPGLILTINNADTWKTEDEIRGSWKARYTWQGKTVTMALGSADIFGRKKGKTPRQALTRAQEIQRMAAEGIDPKVEKAAAKAGRSAASSIPTFEELAVRHWETHKGAWSPKHASQWINNMRDHTFPHIGHLPVSEIDGPMVKLAMDPIWMDIKETADRVLQRIHAVFEDADALDYTGGKKNPADVAKRLLQKRDRRADEKHSASVHWHEAPEFFASIGDDNAACTPLRFMMLCGLRTAPVRFSQWEWLIEDGSVIRVPAKYMKLKPHEKKDKRNDHFLPVTPHIQAELEKLQQGTDFMFPGERAAQVNSNALNDLCKRMHRDKFAIDRKGWVDKETGEIVCGHGMRSTFRTWVGDVKGPEYKDLAEKTISHVVKDPNRGAYDRAKMLKFRYDLLAEWGEYLTGGNNWREI
ncbi:tyrosine-type recombinase/integrase [Microbulbifer sp. MCCC 1A16149]|uniref:tyrosine-type recombinase/integrase n=1 Tax=Microbulbifer sp. MCCC 1A16149 TaxID=3411322 RepID=UPI003D0D8E1A